ncbi:hypothetical protein J4447_02345 [Candidatus Pacearchaeota archaeon]|nr:hypothetical protein [Candidatus Pacearchaeota archaeon]
MPNKLITISAIRYSRHKLVYRLSDDASETHRDFNDFSGLLDYFRSLSEDAKADLRSHSPSFEFLSPSQKRELMKVYESPTDIGKSVCGESKAAETEHSPADNINKALNDAYLFDRRHPLSSDVISDLEESLGHDDFEPDDLLNYDGKDDEVNDKFTDAYLDDLEGGLSS